MSKSSKSSKSEPIEKPEKPEKSSKSDKSTKSEKPEKNGKSEKSDKKFTKKTVTFNTSTVWPSEVVAAFKLHGKSAFRIETNKKPKTYGEGTRQISVFPKMVNVSTKKDEEEWHPACLEVVNAKTSGWVNGGFDNTEQKADTKKDSKSSKSKSKKAKDDDEEDAGDGDGIKPKIPFARSATFKRQADEGEGEVEEPLGEAMWLMAENFKAIIEDYFKGDRDVYTKIFGGRKKEQFEPFKLYRKFKEETDNKDDIVEIKGVDKIKLEDPYFQVNIRCGKNGELGTGVAFKDITDRSKIKKKGEYFIFPDAKVGGMPLTAKTIGKFITPGSMCSGIIAFDQLKTHSFGFSQPVEIGWQKVSAGDEKSQQVLFVHRVAQEGGKTKMDNKGRNLAMLGTVDIEDASDSEDEKKEAKKKAQKTMAKEARPKDDKGSKKSKKSEKEESESSSKSESGSKSGSKSGSESEESNNDDSDASESSEKKSNKKDSKKDSKKGKESKDNKKEKDTKSKKSKKEEKEEDATESADKSSSGSSASVSDIADDE